MVSLYNLKRKMARPPVYEDKLFELSIDPLEFARQYLYRNVPLTSPKLKIKWAVPMRYTFPGNSLSSLIVKALFL